MQHYYTIMRAPHEATIGGGNMDKLTGLATVLGIILAIVAGVVPIPGLDVGLILLILGVIGGIGASQDGAVRMYLAVLVLPAIAVGLGGIPMVGGYLGAIFANLAIVVTGIAASLAARKAYDVIMGNIKSLTAS